MCKLNGVNYLFETEYTYAISHIFSSVFHSHVFLQRHCLAIFKVVVSHWL